MVSKKSVLRNRKWKLRDPFRHRLRNRHSVTSAITLLVKAVAEPCPIQREGNRRVTHNMWPSLIYHNYRPSCVPNGHSVSEFTASVSLLISVLFLVLYPTLAKTTIQLS